MSRVLKSTKTLHCREAFVESCYESNAPHLVQFEPTWLKEKLDLQVAVMFVSFQLPPFPCVSHVVNTVLCITELRLHRFPRSVVGSCGVGRPFCCSLASFRLELWAPVHVLLHWSWSQSKAGNTSCNAKGEAGVHLRDWGLAAAAAELCLWQVKYLQRSTFSCQS